MMRLATKSCLAILLCYAYAISDEDFQSFKTKVQTDIVALENKINNGISEAQDLNLKVKNLELISRLLAPETCLELGNSGMTESIDVMLDPDGKNQGLPPIQVKCQLPEGKSIVGKEVTAKVDRCIAKGCFKKEITYDAPVGQIETLISKSASCSQSIKVQCISAPIVDLVSFFFICCSLDKAIEIAFCFYEFSKEFCQVKKVFFLYLLLKIRCSLSHLVNTLFFPKSHWLSSSLSTWFHQYPMSKFGPIR